MLAPKSVLRALARCYVASRCNVFAQLGKLACAPWCGDAIGISIYQLENVKNQHTVRLAGSLNIR